MIQLGVMKKVDDLRSVWSHEALEFTPWLAKPENMKLLSETIGLDRSDLIYHQNEVLYIIIAKAECSLRLMIYTLKRDDIRLTAMIYHCFRNG